VNEHDGAAAVERGIEIVLLRMSEIAVAGMGQQVDAVELERVEGIVHLAPLRRRPVVGRSPSRRTSLVVRRPCVPALRYMLGSNPW
jgi:hypothetical protein